MYSNLLLALVASVSPSTIEVQQGKASQQGGAAQVAIPTRPIKAPNTRVGLETIYIADPGAQRIVKVDNLNGGGWATLTAATVGLSSLPVSSVATDKKGRIYFCSNRVLHRVDSITGQSHVQMSLPTSAGTSSQVYIRSNGWIYVTLGTSQVFAYDDVSPSAVIKWQSTFSSVTPPSDMHVDSLGTVTLAAETVITGGGNSSYPGLIIELKASGGNPLHYFPVVDLRGVSRDAKGRIFFACQYGVGRIDSISGSGYTLLPTTAPAVGCWVGSARVYTALPSLGKLGGQLLTGAGGLASFGSVGTGPNQFSNPVDIAIHTFHPNAL